MKKGGMKVSDPAKEFKKIDVNGGGSILFDEFSHYCITSALDLEDDDDNEHYEEGEKKLVKDGRDPNKKQVFKAKTDHKDVNVPQRK